MPPFPRAETRTKLQRTRYVRRTPREKRAKGARTVGLTAKRSVNLSHGYKTLSRNETDAGLNKGVITDSGHPRYIPKTQNVHAKARIAKVILSRRDANRPK